MYKQLKCDATDRKWVTTDSGVTGLIVSKLLMEPDEKGISRLALGLELNDAGDIWYQDASKVKTAEKQTVKEAHVCCKIDCQVCNCCVGACAFWDKALAYQKS